MKRILLLVAALLISSPASAGCKAGEQLQLTGTISRIVPVKNTWAVMVNKLNDEVVACHDLDLLFNWKSKASAWYNLIVTSQPSPDCRVGGHVQATLALSEGLGEYYAEVTSWRCN